MILLVEDDDSVRQLAGRVIRKAGYRVLEAANGEDALNRSEGHGGIGLLVTDVVMPQLGGIELARRLCARDPLLRVVYMSGYPRAAVGEDAAMPDAAWITKPFSLPELLLAVRNALDESRATTPMAVSNDGAGAGR